MCNGKLVSFADLSCLDDTPAVAPRSFHLRLVSVLREDSCLCRCCQRERAWDSPVSCHSCSASGTSADKRILPGPEEASFLLSASTPSPGSCTLRATLPTTASRHARRSLSRRCASRQCHPSSRVRLPADPEARRDAPCPFRRSLCLTWMARCGRRKCTSCGVAARRLNRPTAGAV